LFQNTLAKPLQPQTLLSLNMSGVDELFPGFAAGDFAVLHGASALLSSLLCVRAQLPRQLGGLGTGVVYVDGGNTFRLYEVSRIAQLHQLNPRQVLERIYISRAFTAYQLTAIVLERLEEAVKKFGAKLAVISDLVGLFLDKDIPDEEARRVFSQVTAYLSTFAQRNQLTLIATCPLRQPSRRNTYLHALTCARANVVLSVRRFRHGRELALEKHPRFRLGSAEFPSADLALTEFMGRA
jgi:hypothetical protein